MSAPVIAAYIACALIWGTTWYAIRACIAEYPTYAAVALRFVIASSILIPLAVRAKPWPRGRRAWGWLVLAGVLDACAYLLVYVGEERISGALAAVLYGTQPLILAVLLTVARTADRRNAGAATRERLTRAHLIGALVSLAGVAVLFLDRLDVSPQQAVGIVLVLGSVAAATIYAMVMKQHAKGVHGLVATTIFLTVTAIVLSVVAIVANEPLPWPPPPGATLALLYLAVVGSVVAFLVYFWLLAKTGLVVTSTLVFVFPLVALGVDALFEREIVLDARSYAGVAITLAGLAVSLRRR